MANHERGNPIALISVPMDGFTIAAASGMRARMESLDLLANNLANQGSPGFKADREFYSLYVSGDALESSDSSVAMAPTESPVIERRWTDFSQGTITDTGNPTQLALSGQGFFAVKGPNGPLYTRNGNFRLSTAGAIETQEGFPLLDRNNSPISVNPTAPFEVLQNGEIKQASLAIAQIQVVDVAKPQSMDKFAGTYFRMTDPSTEVKPAQVSIYQGKIESANHSPADSAVRLISIMRQFEMLQKAVQLNADMGRRVDDLARVTA